MITTGADHRGFSLTELLIVLAGAAIILASAVPFVDTVIDQYNLLLAAEGIMSQMQYTRMRAVSSNEPFRLRFGPAPGAYQVELDNGTLHSGPFSLPAGIRLNGDDGGNAVTFTDNVVRFLPDGGIPAMGTGSAGRVKLINPTGARIDVVVDSGGMVRLTPTYKQPPAPF
jgi:prepilin-type N-terminal cleavage/methylation domain-containing protein